METLLPTQPSSYKTLIKNSLRLYRASFSKVILFSFLLSFVTFIPRIFSEIIEQDIFSNVPILSLERLWLLLVDIAAIIFFVGILWRINGVARGFHEPLIEDVLVGIKKVIVVFIASLIETIILFAVAVALYALIILLLNHHLIFAHHLMSLLLTAAAFMIQIALVIYVYTLFIFLIPVIAIENKGIWNALERSVYLVWDHWWRVFSVQFTPWLCFFIALAILRYVFHIHVHIYFLAHTVNPIPSLFQLILFAIFIPWVAATLLVQLKDLELRKKLTT